MTQKRSKRNYKKIALALSLLAILIWSVLGTGASLAWFSDSAERITNIFHYADFDVTVSYRDDAGNWHELDGQTTVFDDEALYEPGYVQVVYLRIDNNGTVPFNYNAAVNITNYTTAPNKLGGTVNLCDHLKYGVIIEDTEAAMDAAVADRELAKDVANTDLGNYSSSDELADGDSAYMALVVRMPDEVRNDANYRGDKAPTVELGIIVTADQITN